MPTIFDETVALTRRKGDTWYAGALGNWEARKMTLDCSFLGPGTYEAVIFRDGLNADCNATNYRREVVRVSATDKLRIKLSGGGG